MITLWNPATQTFEAKTGPDAEKLSPQTLLLNVLIELRAMNAILLAKQRSVVNEEITQFRSDAVNDAANPVI